MRHRHKRSILYKNLDVVAIVTIPANFTHAVDAHEPTHIDVQINNLNADFTNDIRRAVPDAITQFYQQQGGASPFLVTLQEQNVRRQDIQLFQYSAMPLVVLLLVVSGIVSSSLAAAGEWETRTIKELLLSPTTNAAIITGKVLTGFVTTTALGVLVLGVGDLLGWVQPVRGILVDCTAHCGVGGAVQRRVGSGTRSSAPADSTGEFRRNCPGALSFLLDRGHRSAGL